MYRKIEHFIKSTLQSKDNKILCIYGARQIGKTYIIEKVSKELFKNYVYINFDSDNKGERLFKNVKSTTDFYIQLTTKYGQNLDINTNTIVFLDEIQIYPQFFSLLKQLNIDNKYKYICSGSQLGSFIKNESGLSPMGSVIEKRMYPMDFEEFLIANGTGEEAINYVKTCFDKKETVNETTHEYFLKMFKTYLFTGGLPECIKIYVEEKNILKIKNIQSTTYQYYIDDSTKYDIENKLKITRLYELLSSNMQNKVKRTQLSKIDNKKNSYNKYHQEFEYLTKSGIALENKAISEPKFPLIQSTYKNLTKLYYNDVGILSEILYKNNINAILNNDTGINLGSIYETVVAQELSAHDHKLYYYDQKKVGEVDFLIDDYDNLSVLPIEVKSGKEPGTYRALPKLMKIQNYNIKQGYVLSNKREVIQENNIIKMPIYNIMFI